MSSVRELRRLSVDSVALTLVSTPHTLTPSHPHTLTHSSSGFLCGAGIADSAGISCAGSSPSTTAHGLAQGRESQQVQCVWVCVFTCVCWLSYVCLHYSCITYSFLPCSVICNYMHRELVECDLTLAGLVVMQNRLKTQTTPVISTLTQAGIRTLMITGMIHCIARHFRG